MTEHQATQFRDDRNRAPRIARESDAEGAEVPMREEGERLTFEPIRTHRLLDLLASLALQDVDGSQVERLPPQTRDELNRTAWS